MHDALTVAGKFLRSFNFGTWPLRISILDCIRNSCDIIGCVCLTVAFQLYLGGDFIWRDMIPVMFLYIINFAAKVTYHSLYYSVLIGLILFGSRPMFYRIFLPAVIVMTVMQDESKSPSCPVAPRTDHTNGNAVITIRDRTTELALMDQNIDTCLIAFDQGRHFLRLVAFIYVPSTVDNLRIQLMISGLHCVAPELVVYHQTLTGEFNECVFTTRTELNQQQECGFLCNNVGPDKLVVRVYIQFERWYRKEATIVRICEMSLAN